MTSAPETIRVDQTLSAAHKMMIDRDLRHLPVVRDGKLAGVLSQRDLYFLERIGGVDVDVDSIGDAMSPDVYITTVDAKLTDVARTMAEHKYGCAVIVKEDLVVGIFTVTDALRHIAGASSTP